MPKRLKTQGVPNLGFSAKTMDKAKQQAMSSSGIKLTSNGVNVQDGFQHLVGRAEHGDPHAQRQLRNGKYAFPHLRDFDSLPELEGDQLIDHFITALTTQPKHLYANYKARGAKTLMKQISISLQRAHRFRVDDDLVERVLSDSAGADWEKIFSVINNAIPPFDNMWIEGERNSRLFQRWRNDDTHFAPEWVGWHIQRAGVVRGFKEGDTWPNCLVKPTTLFLTSDDTIVVQKYIKPQSHAVEKLSYYIPKTCYIFTGKEHIRKIPYEQQQSKSFQCLGEHWSTEIREFAPAHIRMNLEKRINSSLGISYPLDDYGIMLKQPEALSTTVTSSTAMYEDDIRMLAWLLSELNFTWHESKLVGKPTRKNRALIATKPTIDLKTIEIDLPKPKGIVLRTETPSEEGCRKLHWVRGHPRKYRDGRIVRIKPYQRGNAKFGEVIKDYSLKLDKREKEDA